MGSEIHKYPVVLKSDICEFIKNVKFIEEERNKAFQTDFFQQFKNRYNGIPVFSRFICSDKKKFQSCIHWFGLNAIPNPTPTNDLHYDYVSYSINPLIFSLLTNSSLEKVTDVDNNGDYFTALDNHHNDIDKFQNIHFETIDPCRFEDELTELALRGSIYIEWEYSPVKTKKMAVDFVAEIIEGRYDDFKIYKTIDPWSGYTMGFFVAYFIFDELKSEFWILSKDDYD